MAKSFLACFALAASFAFSGCKNDSGNVFITLDYVAATGRYRVGEAIAPNAPILSGGLFSNFAVNPALPGGLALDPLDGEITGVPTTETATASYVISADFEGETFFTAVAITVGPQLPASFQSLEEGFAVEEIANGLDTPARIALAPDGRLFFVELDTGNVRIIDATGALLPTPFATVPVLTGGHQGLFGLALSPTFASNGFVYVAAATPASGPDPDRTRIVRFTDVADLGTSETVIVDDLPVSAQNNGGEIVFDATGNLFVSIGDNETAANAQSSSTLAGKILRYTATGAIPAGNPTAGNPEWCRGLRNTYALAVHPITGDLFGADNGDTSDDELNYLAGGLNFEWGDTTGTLGPLIGLRIQNWSTTIVPTAILFHSGSGGYSEFRNELLLAAYGDEDIRRLGLSGTAFTTLQSETTFATFVPNANDNKPLDILEAADGSLIVSTFTAIYRIFKF